MSDPHVEPAPTEPVETPPENPTIPTENSLYKYDEKTLARLVTAFNNGYNITEACQYSNIDRDTYYRWLVEVDGFAVKMEEAKALPNRLAKEKVVRAIESNDIGSARWWLERRDPDFKHKAEVDNNIGIQETRKKIGDFLDDNDNPDDEREQPAAADSETAGDEVAIPPTDIS